MRRAHALPVDVDYGLDEAGRPGPDHDLAAVRLTPGGGRVAVQRASRRALDPEAERDVVRVVVLAREVPEVEVRIAVARVLDPGDPHVVKALVRRREDR